MKKRKIKWLVLGASISISYLNGKPFYDSYSPDSNSDGLSICGGSKDEAILGISVK
jgi:hypothetical protein